MTLSKATDPTTTRGADSDESVVIRSTMSVLLSYAIARFKVQPDLKGNY